MAERREEEEGEEGARLWGSGGLYRPKSSWVRNGMTGGGRFGPGESTASGRSGSGAAHGWGCRGGSGSGLGRVWAWEGAKGRARWHWRAPWVHLAASAPWTRSTGGVWRAAGETEHREERDGGEGLFVISENSGTSR